MMRTIALAALVLAASGAPRGIAAPENIEIVTMDYAFKLPTELPAGRAAFRLRNAGKKRHELNISLLKPGVTPQQVLAAMNASQSMTPLLEAGVGVLFADAGERSSAAVSTELIPGRSYFVRCIFRDSASKPKHENMGMFGIIRVGATKTPAQATTPIDTIVGTDYAFQYRRTLAPARVASHS